MGYRTEFGNQGEMWLARAVIGPLTKSATFFKLNHFFSFGFSVLSGCGGVLGGFGSRPSFRASSFAIR